MKSNILTFKGLGEGIITLNFAQFSDHNFTLFFGQSSFSQILFCRYATNKLLSLGLASTLEFYRKKRT